MTAPRELPSFRHGLIVQRYLRFVVAAWRALTWKHLLYTFLLGLTWSNVEIAGRMPDFLETKSWGPAVNNLVSMQLNGFAVLFAVLVADRESPPPLCHWWSYVVAVMIGVLAGSTLAWLVSQQILELPSAYQANGAREGFETFVFRHATHRFVVCGLVTWVYVFGRLAAHRMSVLRVMQLERAQVEKRVLESRLAAMQAHVDPAFIRDTLVQVERMYEFEAKAADRMLREVTRYLRSAIPQTFDPASTVATEIQLTNAFLNIVGMQSRDRLVRIGGASSVDELTRLPRMLLLPMINHALAHRAERAQGDEWFDIDVVVNGDRLKLTIRDRGSGFASDGANDPDLQHLRARLAGLYGDGAQLTLRESANGTDAELEIPYEVASRNPVDAGIWAVAD